MSFFLLELFSFGSAMTSHISEADETLNVQDLNTNKTEQYDTVHTHGSKGAWGCLGARTSLRTTADLAASSSAAQGNAAQEHNTTELLDPMLSHFDPTPSYTQVFNNGRTDLHASP